MKIIIDGRMIGWTGIGRYSIELLNHLQEIDQDNEYVVLVRSVDWDKWQPISSNFNRVRCDIEPYSLAEQLKLPWQIRKLRPDIVHFLSINSPIIGHFRRVTTVHDLTLIDYDVARGSWIKQQVYGLKRLVLRIHVNLVLRRSRRVIADTEFGRQNLVKRNLIRPNNGHAIHLGAGIATNNLIKPSPYPPLINQRFILAVGNAFPYKNLQRLIDAYALARPRETKLVLVGKPDYFYEQLQTYVKNNKIVGVHFAGFVPDTQLAWLYQQTSLYVFPSLSEGFGLPGLEAMAYGAPVASSNATCLPEVYGEAAAYFDPNDTVDIARVITELLNDAKLSSKLIKAGHEQVAKYSWERMAHQTLEVYNRAPGAE